MGPIDSIRLPQPSEPKRGGIRGFCGSCLRITLVLAVLYLLICIGARFVSTWMLFPAPEVTYGEKLRGLVMIPAADGQRIAAVYLPNAVATKIILLFHGNGDDLGPTMGRIEALNARGFSVLAVDYTGYGLSDGKPSEDGLYAAADAAYSYATGLLGWAPEKVISHGVSLGGAASMWVATRHKVGGLIMESSFMSAYRVMTSYPFVLGDRMRNLARMKAVRCPVLVIHGCDDGLVGWEHGRRLFEAAPEPKRSLWVPDAGHNNVVSTAGDPYWRTLTDFAAGL